LLTSLVNWKLDVNKVDLEFSVSLDTDKEWRTSSSSNNLVGEVGGFENESKRSFELLDDGLDELGKVESLMRLTVVDVFTESRNDLGVSVGVKDVASLVQDVFELLVVCDDTIVDQAEFGDDVADVGMTIEWGRNTMRRPSGVGH
jgi:hypothetical protein